MNTPKGRGVACILDVKKADVVKKNKGRSNLNMGSKGGPLIGLEVAFYSEEMGIMKGSKVFIKPDRINSTWAKEVLTVGETDFILVPASEVQLVQYPEIMES